MPTREQEERVDRFRAAFNEIENQLRLTLSEPNSTSFVQLINQQADANPRWGARDGRDLRSFAGLRNALVHSYAGGELILSVPTEETIRRIEQIRDRLLNSEKVIPRFQRQVITVAPESTVTAVLDLVQQHHFSQFPVYRGEAFLGLLTENGITRWLARQTSSEFALVDFSEVTVATLLGAEETRQNVSFISRRSDVDHAFDRFGRNPALEALIITHAGQRDQAPLGIITRWDVVDGVA